MIPPTPKGKDMNIYELYKTNTEKEQKGLPVKFGDATVYIATSNLTGNPKMAKMQAEYIERATKRKGVESKPEELKEKMLDLYAECVVTGWENVRDENGKEIPYSKENVLKIFKDLPHFLDAIVAFSSDFTNYREKAIDDVVKN